MTDRLRAGSVVVRLVVLLLVLACGHAWADESPAKPWAIGVTEEQQAKALAFFEEGNQQFQESRFAQALTKYREAIAHWDHPAIRFNIAVCLINLGQLVEAKDNLERGLAHGPAPLDEGVYAQGLTYRKLLEGQLVSVTIRCSEPGAEISLDGRPLFVGPGEAHRHLLPGDHQIVATKPGFITASERLTLVAGTTIAHDVRLVAFRSTTTRTVRRWERHQPWMVVAGGGLVAAMGSLVLAWAANNFDDYDAAIKRECPTGCSAERVSELSSVTAKAARADWQQNLGGTLLVVGGLGIVGGLVGVILNMPRSVVEEAPAPVISPARGGGTVGLRWHF